MSFNKIRNSSLPKVNFGIKLFEIYLFEEFKDKRKNIFFTNS